MGGDGVSTTTELVTIDGRAFARAARALERHGFEEVASDTVKHALRQSANVVRGNVKTEARRHHRTGHLEAGVHTTWKGAGLAFQLRVSSTGPEAHLITGGVRPHKIDAGRPMNIGGVIGFKDAVEHPGIKADPYVHRGIKESLPAIQAIVTAAARDMAAQLTERMRATR
jgi:hypothetical protein